MAKPLDLTDPLQSAAFAELIDDFWKSDIGHYLKNRAQAESDEATRNLVENCHTMSHEERITAQAAIWRASKFAEWLGEAYAQGCADLEILKEEEDAAGN